MTQGVTQNVDTDLGQQRSTADSGNEPSMEICKESSIKNEVCDKKEAQGCESGNMQVNNSAGVVGRSEEAALSSASTDKVTNDTASELKEEGVNEMETEPVPASRVETGSANLQPGQSMFVQPGGPSDSQGELEQRKRLAVSDNIISTNDQSFQDNSSLTTSNSDFASISHDSSTPVHAHSSQTTSSIHTGAQLKFSQEESHDGNGNSQRNITSDTITKSASLERTSGVQSTHPIASHELTKVAQFASKVYSTSRLPD